MIDSSASTNSSVERIDIDALLQAAASDPEGYSSYLYDDLPDMPEIPPDWETAFTRAAQWDDLKDPYGFLFCCAEVLVKLNSSWVGMADLFERILALHSGLLEFQLIGDYYVRNSRTIPLSVSTKVLDSFDAMPFVVRLALRIDGPCRELVEACRKSSVHSP